MSAEKVAAAAPADLIARRVKELVDAAPSLHPGQRDRLAALLRSAVR